MLVQKALEDQESEAHVLISCDLNKEDKVYHALKDVDGVLDVSNVSGAYDIVARVKSSTPESLKHIIVWKIRAMLHVRSTLTLTSTHCHHNVA